MRKPKSIRQLIKTADRWFSRFIRLQAASDSGHCACITCGVVRFWKEIDAGHWINRDKLGTRFELYNCHPQCISCNRFKSGRGAEYSEYIINTYGEKEFNRLLKLSRQKTTLTKEELEEIIECCKKGVKILKKAKGL